ncbi:MAG: hypothetical protein AB7R89_09605 [Dehalococcoidia bacterium]
MADQDRDQLDKPDEGEASAEVVIRDDHVTISGEQEAIEDYLDAREIDRRLADPSNHTRLSLAELRAKRGL